MKSIFILRHSYSPKPILLSQSSPVAQWRNLTTNQKGKISMAKKTPVETQCESATPPVAAPARKRQSTPIQADFAVGIEQAKKTITSLKALNKIVAVIEKCDRNAQEQLAAWLTKKLSPPAGE